MSEEEQPLDPRAQGLVDLARDSLGQLTDGRRVAGLHALRDRVSSRQRVRSVLRVTMALTGALSLVCGVVLTLSAVKHRDKVASHLGLRVEGAELRADGTVQGPGSARPVLHFSDGSEVSLKEGARARVRSMDGHGARITVERGEAHVYVVHAEGTHWTFDAGPFVVAVTGTAFSLSWREDTQRLDVRLENGTVNVSGPASDAPLALRAGQWLSWRGGQGGEVRIRSLDATDDAEETAGNADLLAGVDRSEPATPIAGTALDTSPGAVPSLDVPPRGDALRRKTPRPGHERNWASDLARGRSEAIVSDAISLGIEGVFAHSSGNDLAALADAARYTHRQDVARGAFLAQRRRFPGSDYAHVASFGLGRLDDADQDLRAALTWFDTYLAEAPNGRYASEALGHKMTIVKLLEGKEAAQAWADLYLRRFPNGTYAAAARAVTGTP